MRLGEYLVSLEGNRTRRQVFVSDKNLAVGVSDRAVDDAQFYRCAGLVQEAAKCTRMNLFMKSGIGWIV